MQSKSDAAGDGVQALLGLAHAHAHAHAPLPPCDPALSRAPAPNLVRSPPVGVSAVLRAEQPTATAPPQHLPPPPQPPRLDQAPALSALPPHVPRLPPISTTEGRHTLVAPHPQPPPPPPPEPQLPDASRTDVPRLASISELASAGSPQIATLPAFNSLPGCAFRNTLPPLPPPQAQRQELPQLGTWARPHVPTLHASTAAFPLPTPPVRDYRPPMSSPTIFSMPVHHHSAQLRTELHHTPLYYPQPTPPPPPPQPQYSALPPALPQLHTPQQPHTRIPSIPTFSGSASYLPPPPPLPFRTDGLGPSTFVPQSRTIPDDKLAPILNGIAKPVVTEDRSTCGDSTTEPAKQSAKLNSTDLPTSVPKLGVPTSSRTSIADIMNPTDNSVVTLADVAAKVEHLPVVEDARIESPPESRPAPTPKVKVERELPAAAEKVVPDGSRKKSSSSNQRDEKVRSEPKRDSEPVAKPQPPALPSLPPNGVPKRKENGTPAWNELVPMREYAKSNASSAKRSSVEKVDIVRRDSSGSADDGKVFADHKQRPEKDSSSETEHGAEEEPSEVTRCPCGSIADCGTMVQCDQCDTWQHRICMGFKRKSELPKKYYCNLCRPEEMRIDCVAHPKFREKIQGRGPEAVFGPLLSIVKPIELRKRFSNHLRKKLEMNRELNYDQVFLHYATLYRTQFGKDRQSMIEGLAILTELPSKEISSRLDTAIRKSKKEVTTDVMDFANGDRHERKKSDAVANQHGKRNRPLSSNFDMLHELVETSKMSAKRSTPEKELSAAEKNRLSREERKNRQVLDLFARLEERDKKKPRVGEPSGSPKSASVASPKDARPTSKSALTPSGSVKLLPTVNQVEANADRDVISVDAAKNPAPSLIPAPPKRERSGKERKENRRREARDVRKDGAGSSSDAGKRSVIGGARKRERQILSSASQRKRGKAEKQTKLADLDPSLLFSYRLPGPSCLGSRIIPVTRRSKLDNEALKEELANKNGMSAKQSTLKGRYQAASQAEELERNQNKHHSIRKRFSETYAAEKLFGLVPHDSTEEAQPVLEKVSQPPAEDVNDKKAYSASEPVDANCESHKALTRDYSLKKRVLNRSNGETRQKCVDKVCFKKRMVRSGPSCVSVCGTEDDDKKEEEKKVAGVPKADAKSSPAPAPAVQPVKPIALRSAPIKKVHTPSPPPRPPPLRSSPLLPNDKKPIPNGPRFVAATPPLRSRPAPSAGTKKAPPLRSPAASPPLRSAAPSPPLRSVPPLRSAPSPPSGRSVPPLRSAPSPPPGKSVPPLRSAPTPPAGRSVPPLRSAPSPPPGRSVPPLRSAPSPPAGRGAPPLRSAAPSPPSGRSVPPLRSSAPSPPPSRQGVPRRNSAPSPLHSSRPGVPRRNSAPSPPPLRSSAPSPPGRPAPPLRSSAPSPPSGRPVPPLRSSAVPSATIRRPIPVRASAPSPPLGTSKTPPPPLRSTPFPRIPLRSKPLALADNKNLNKTTSLPEPNGDGGRLTANGHDSAAAASTELKIDVTGPGDSASDILQARLSGFLKSNNNKAPPAAMGNDAQTTPSPRVPKHHPRMNHAHGRHSRGPANSMNPSPRVHGPGLGKYGGNGGGGGGSGQWRSFDGHGGPPKRPHSTLGSRSGMKDGRMRNGMANGKGGGDRGGGGGADTTPWGRYRQQNGWGAVYANPGANSSQDGGRHGQRRRGGGGPHGGGGHG